MFLGKLDDGLAERPTVMDTTSLLSHQVSFYHVPFRYGTDMVNML